MPNHEDNHVVIVGTEENVRRVLDTCIKPTVNDTYHSHYFDFNEVVPQPDNIEQGGCSGEVVNGIHEDGKICWYAWRIEHWGTKWGAYDLNYEGIETGPHGDRFLAYVLFQTAWSAPHPVFKAIEEKFDVEVHAWTRDEGGFEPQVWGDPHRFFEITDIPTVWDDKTQDERPATKQEIADEEAYSYWEIELRDETERLALEKTKEDA